MNKSTGLAWYALRITYSRELAFKQYLDDRNIENFIPMRYEYVVKGERKIRKLVPVVHNLVFVYASRLQIDEMKTTAGTQLPIRYIMDRETNQPITIPETQISKLCISIPLPSPLRRESVFVLPEGFSKVLKENLFV